MSFYQASFAHHALKTAIHKGLIVRPKTCQDCGRTPEDRTIVIRVGSCPRVQKRCAIEGHHHDYAKPLDVAWLCRRCHCGRHRNKFTAARHYTSRPMGAREIKAVLGKDYWDRNTADAVEAVKARRKPTKRKAAR